MSSSSKQQPFSFQSIALGRKSATSSLSADSGKIVLLEKLHELYHKKFLDKVKEWNRVHDTSIEHFSEYIQLIQLLNRVKPNTENELLNNQSMSNNSTMMDISMTKKMKQAHSSLLECIEEFFVIVHDLKEVVSEMKLKIQDSQSTSDDCSNMMTKLSEKGDYHMLSSALDYVRYATTYLSMLENELDFKTITFQSLNELESQYVLNTYIIAWKKQSFIDENKLCQLEMEYFMHDKATTNL